VGRPSKARTPWPSTSGTRQDIDKTLEPGGDSAGSNNPTVARGLVSHVTARNIPHGQGSLLLTIIILEQSSISGPVPSSSRYPPIQFVKAGESIGDNRKQKERIRTKKTGGGTGSGMLQWKVTEYGKLYLSGLGDEDWSLCDKDCSWCGHCADGVAF
jgi:hypothetical protein